MLFSYGRIPILYNGYPLNPPAESYLVLPYKHHYTDDNTEVITGFFIPSYAALDKPEVVDSRGVVDTEKAK